MIKSLVKSIKEKNNKKKKYIIYILVIIYVLFYKPYSNIDCEPCLIEYCAYNTIYLKLLRILYTLIGFITLNISFITNTIFTKGLNFENPIFNNNYGNGNYGLFDHKYAFTLFETTGGSYMQFAATNSLYWSFPTCDNSNNFLEIPKKFNKKEYTIHRFVVHPRNKFGEYFKKLIDNRKPYFLIKEKIDKEESTYYEVRLILSNTLVKKTSLTDIWKILEQNDNGAKIILSRKLRNYYIGNCNEPIGKGLGQGRSLFVAIDYYDNFKNISLK